MATVQNINGQYHLIGDRPPRRLGKFLDADGVLASIDKETVKFTPPNQLNDDWDCIPLSYNREDVEKVWQKNPLSLCFPELKESFVEEFLKRDWRPFREKLSQTIAIASFADVNGCDNEWMWNHYGDQHRGALVLYDTSIMGEFIKVQYLDSRPCISLPVNTELFSFEDVIAVSRTKERRTKDHWEKECEWRKTEQLCALDEVTTAKGKIYLKSYPNALKMVICGSKMEEPIFHAITEKAIKKGIPVQKEY
jgi:hypothetical protein